MVLPSPRRVPHHILIFSISVLRFYAFVLHRQQKRPSVRFGLLEEDKVSLEHRYPRHPGIMCRSLYLQTQNRPKCYRVLSAFRQENRYHPFRIPHLRSRQRAGPWLNRVLSACWLSTSSFQWKIFRYWRYYPPSKAS